MKYNGAKYKKAQTTMTLLAESPSINLLTINKSFTFLFILSKLPMKLCLPCYRYQHEEYKKALHFFLFFVQITNEFVFTNYRYEHEIFPFY